MPRGPSTRTLLKLGWRFPVYAAPEQEGATRAQTRRRALSFAEAFAYVAGDDPRPLLVLRECTVCNGTDDALLSRNVDNEKTFLLSRWFNCVKLPPDVMDEDHPFRNLFPGGRSEHLFMATRDADLRIPLESERSRAELWDSMLKVLAAEYLQDPATSLEHVRKLLDKLDAADERIAQLQDRLEQILESDGPDSIKLGKVRKELGKAREERDKLLATVMKASELRLKETVAPAAAGAPSGGDAG